jgi:hypothetical protein
METSTGTTIARHQPFSGQSGHSATLFLRSVTIILAALFCTVIAMVPHSFANEQGRGNGNGNGNIGIGNGNGNNGNFNGNGNRGMNNGNWNQTSGNGNGRVGNNLGNGR